MAEQTQWTGKVICFVCKVILGCEESDLQVRDGQCIVECCQCHMPITLLAILPPEVRARTEARHAG